MIPLQDQMNLDDPEEYFLWALVNMDGMSGAPLILPEPVLRVWSKHLYDCGFRHHPELQQITYRPPVSGTSILEAGGGEWVPCEEGES